MRSSNPCRQIGYTVTAPQFPLTSLATDVARLRQVLRRQTGPTVVVGHSYGGQIMTSLGTDSAGVAALVYVAAFGLDEGESLGALLGGGPPTPSLAHLIVDEQGFAWLPEEDYVGHFENQINHWNAKLTPCPVSGVVDSSNGSRARRGRTARFSSTAE